MLARRSKKKAAAIEREVLPHLEALNGYALYLTRKKTDAEDLVQETLVKAVNAFSQYQEGTNCKAWLFRIMHNTFLNNIRKQRVQVEFEEHGVAELSQREDMKGFVRANRSPEESFVGQLSRVKVREAIEKLPPEFRAVVILADLEEFSYKEIAEILSCPIGTVMSRLHRGRKLLRMRLLQWAREMGLVDEPEAEEEQHRDEEIPEPGNVTPLAAYRGANGQGKEDAP